MERNALGTVLLAAIVLVIATNKPHAAMVDDRASAAGGVCTTCFSVRVGLPRVVRGPAPSLGDNYFSEIKLPDGRFRGFTAAALTYAIDGKSVWAMGGPGVTVLQRGPKGSTYSCGQWLQHAEQVGNTTLGFIHDETQCNYSNHSQTHKSMSLATSLDYGLTWNRVGTIISGADEPASGKQTGEGDCSVVDGKDGYYYAYCGRAKDSAIIVARAPVARPGPGNWMKYYQGAWNQPGLGGDSTKLSGNVRPITAYWLTTGDTLNLGEVPGGLGLFFSRDHVNFTSMSVPLLAKDKGSWSRPAPSELLFYWSLIDAGTGSNQLSDHWMLFYLDVQPNEDFDKRYLVSRPIDVFRNRKPDEPQVGVELGRWHNAALRDRWATTAAVPGNYTDYQLDRKLGYLMTAPDPSVPSVELVDCVIQSPGHLDHMLEQQTYCDAGKYQRLRTAGWVYAQARTGTVPIYRCYSAQDRSHFASNAQDCEKLGKNERLLGYALKQ